MLCGLALWGKQLPPESGKDPNIKMALELIAPLSKTPKFPESCVAAYNLLQNLGIDPKDFQKVREFLKS